MQFERTDARKQYLPRIYTQGCLNNLCHRIMFLHLSFRSTLNNKIEVLLTAKVQKEITQSFVHRLHTPFLYSNMLL